MPDPELQLNRCLTVPVCVAHLTSVLVVTTLPDIPGVSPWTLYRNCFLGGTFAGMLAAGLYNWLWPSSWQHHSWETKIKVAHIRSSMAQVRAIIKDEEKKNAPVTWDPEGGEERCADAGGPGPDAGGAGR